MEGKVIRLATDRFSLPEGDVIIQWPTPLSVESQELLEEVLQLVIRKTKRQHSEAHND